MESDHDGADEALVDPGGGTPRLRGGGGSGGVDDPDRRGLTLVSAPPCAVGQPRPACSGYPAAGDCDGTAAVGGYCRACYYRRRRALLRSGAWHAQARRPRQGLAALEREAMRLLRAYKRERGCWPSGEVLLALLPPGEDRRLLATGLWSLYGRGLIHNELVPSRLR